MTRFELVKMMGDNDKADWAMNKILEAVKPDFVVMVLKANANALEKEIKEKEENGYYTEFAEFPEDFNIWREPEGSPLSIQWDNNTQREIEHDGDKMSARFASNMWVHALNHKNA